MKYLVSSGDETMKYCVFLRSYNTVQNRIYIYIPDQSDTVCHVRLTQHITDCCYRIGQESLSDF